MSQSPVQDQSSPQNSQQVLPQAGPDATAEPHPPLPCLPASTRFTSTLPLKPEYRDHPGFIRQIYGAILTPKFRIRYAEKVSGLPKGSIKTYNEAHVRVARMHPLPGLVNVQVHWEPPKDSDELWPTAIIVRFVPIIPFSGDWEGKDVGAENAEGGQALTAEKVEDRIKEKTRHMMGLRGLLRFRWFNLYELESEGKDLDDPDALWKNTLRGE
ncbi:hypothetical protein NLJ89_g3207 [Agrocybe chaxingu]|uniref:Uncharacterized protein n=1 Tax=Agrocybe chaxingu TaxID=84603 RepID=A0A9W8KA74_9AGAR|nr:hypothetical protein NLJ89_g3207 [Agrocybe chaxingu]